MEIYKNASLTIFQSQYLFNIKTDALENYIYRLEANKVNIRKTYSI